MRPGSSNILTIRPFSRGQTAWHYLSVWIAMPVPDWMSPWRECSLVTDLSGLFVRIFFKNGCLVMRSILVLVVIHRSSLANPAVSSLRNLSSLLSRSALHLLFYATRDI